MPSYKWDNTNKPKIEGRWGASESLGAKIETMFSRFTQRVFLWLIDFMSDRLVDIFDTSMKIMKPGMDRATAGVFPHLKSIKGMPDFYYDMLNAIEKEQGETSFFTKLVVMYATVRGIIFGGLQPYSDLANQWALNQIRTWLPDPATAATMYRIGKLDASALKNIMGGLGVPDGLQDNIYEMTHNLPSVGETIAGFWRGAVSSVEFDARLKRMGYEAEDIAIFRELSEQLPPLSDLIHMLVRDAFNDSASSRYGYDEDFPQEINEFFEKQGYSADWAKRYWRSHWNLPSPTQGYEMLHRGLIDTSDLDTLLKISDYPPFWREKLRNISFNVLTRVDVRRLLQAGLIDRDKTLETYKKMGYTPEDAELLTQFAVEGISQDEKDLTKTDVLNLYEEGLTDRGATQSNLMKMGYDAQEADAILDLSDVNIAKAARTDLINYAKERFLAREISADQARGELAQIGLKSQSVERYVLNWERQTEVENALPSMADVKRWYMGDYIDENKLRDFLKRHRHTSENIEIYVKELNDNKAEVQSEQASGL